MKFGRIVSFSLLAAASLLPALRAQEAAAPKVGPIVKRISDAATQAKSYSYEGDLLLSGKRGKNGEGHVLGKAHVKLAVGGDGKSYLRIRPEEKDEYLLISNGQKSWEFVPKLKQYTEQDGAAIAGGDDDEDDGADGNEKDLSQSFAWQVIEILRAAYPTAQAVDMPSAMEIKYEGKKQKWPLVRVLSKKTARDGVTLTQLVTDPETGRIGRLLWSNSRGDGDDVFVIQMQVDFVSLELGSVDASLFEYEPPKNAKKVDAVPIPGQTGSFLLAKPAPDFELKTLEGERVKLSDLRGKPVLLNFWASWCGPCRREMPAIAKIAEDYKAQGLIVLGVNDEDKGTAKSFAKKYDLPFDTLDDSSRKAHKLYRIQSIPATYVIAPDGKVMRFLRGSQDEKEFRAALKSVGL